MANENLTENEVQGFGYQGGSEDIDSAYDSTGKDEPELSEEEIRKLEMDLAKERLQLEKDKEDQRRALQADAAMRQIVNTLPKTLPTQTPGQGKIYMGPTISPTAFNALPQGARIMPPPPAPLTPEAQGALQQRMAFGTGGESDAAALARLRAADRPGGRTLSVRTETPTLTSADPMMQRFAMQEQVKRAVASGMPFNEAFALYAPGVLGRGRGGYGGYRGIAPPRPMTEAQRLSAENAKRAAELRAREIAASEMRAKAEADKLTLRGTTDPITKDRIKSLNDRIAAKEKSLTPGMRGTKAEQAIKDDIANLERQIADLTGQKPSPAVRPPAGARKEVIRLYKGKRAVFDAETKQFIRYA